MGVGTVFLETGTNSIADSVTSLTGYLNTAVGFLTGNEVMLLFLAGSVIGLAFTLFKRAKKAVR